MVWSNHDEDIFICFITFIRLGLGLAIASWVRVIASIMRPFSIVLGFRAGYR